MVIIAIPQLAAVQEEAVEVVGGGEAAGAGGVDAGDDDIDDIDDIDDPPPHALRATINKVHAAAGNQRR
jgi:hypothetical protein